MRTYEREKERLREGKSRTEKGKRDLGRKKGKEKVRRNRERKRGAHGQE